MSKLVKDKEHFDFFLHPLFAPKFDFPANFAKRILNLLGFELEDAYKHFRNVLCDLDSAYALSVVMKRVL